MEILVVGAGISGSLVASFLARNSARASVTLWDKARGNGGRFTTHSHNGLSVDMGAQYLTQTPATEEVLKELTLTNIVKPFHGVIEGNAHTGNTNFVATNGMSSVCKYFIKQSKASVKFEHCLSSISLQERKALCSTKAGVEEKFDCVVLTLPSPQLLQLQGNLISHVTPNILENLSKVKYSSRYALGVFYPGLIEIPKWTAKYFDNSIVRYMCWDDKKRGLSEGSSLLVHTSVPFGLEHLETDKEEVAEIVMAEVNHLIPGLPPPTHCNTLRWRYSQVWERYPGSHDFVVLSHDPLVIATGDSISGSNFDNCFRAAQNTSTFLVSRIK